MALTFKVRCFSFPEYLINFQEAVSLLQAIFLASMVCTCVHADDCSRSLRGTNAIGVTINSDILQNAADIRAIISRSSLKGRSSYYNDQLVLWSVFQDLKAVCLGRFSLLLLRSVLRSLVAMLSAGMIMLEAYGLGFQSARLPHQSLRLR